MISRQYTRKIQIYKTTSVSDGFGGNTVIDVLIGSYWAEVKQNSAFKDNSIGNSEIKNNYSFKIRTNANLENDISDLSIVYNAKKYVVNDIRYDDELFRFVNITANGIS
jgi:SPP1 family predicted phage head-tail adaptor